MLRNLQDHPGWVYLMTDLARHKSLFETQRALLLSRIPLSTDSETFVRQLIRFDEALTWITWLQWRIEQANALPVARLPLPQEQVESPSIH